MKKIAISVILITIFCVGQTGMVYAAGDSWVQDAFGAAGDFLHEDTTDELGIASPILIFFTNLIQGINIILLVVLSSLSVISLAIVGIRYIAHGAVPDQKVLAKKQLHTVFKGMAYGFGAYAIWRIAIGIVGIIINTFAA